jgi:hypothetical protein
VPALLVEAAEARVQALEPDERGESRGDIAREALRHGTQIEDVAILRDREQQRVRRLQGRRELPQPQQLANALDFPFYHLKRLRRPGTSLSLSCARFMPGGARPSYWKL